MLYDVSIFKNKYNTFTCTHISENKKMYRLTKSPHRYNQGSKYMML